MKCVLDLSHLFSAPVKSHAGSRPSLLSFPLWGLARKERGGNFSSDIPNREKTCLHLCIAQLF